MPLYLVRHAKAGSRSAWTEDDRLRPLVLCPRRRIVRVHQDVRVDELPSVVSPKLPYI